MYYLMLHALINLEFDSKNKSITIYLTYFKIMIEKSG